MLQWIVTIVIATSMGNHPLLADEEIVQNPEQFHGTWEREFQAADGGKVRVMKIITPTHFAVFQQRQTEQTHSLQSHGGTCEIDGAAFTEFYDYSSNPKLVGTSAKSKLRLIEGELRQTWTTPNGQSVIEVWRRAAREKPKAPANSMD